MAECVRVCVSVSAGLYGSVFEYVSVFIDQSHLSASEYGSSPIQGR